MPARFAADRRFVRADNGAGGGEQLAQLAQDGDLVSLPGSQ